MKRTYLSLAALATLCFSLLLISGCGSSGGNKEGGGPVATVTAAACTTCHSTTAEVLTGDPIVANYTASVHNLNSVGCQDCHGAGGAHNGVGPIPYPKPNQEQCKSCHDSGTATSYALVTKYESSKHMNNVLEEGEPCNRCHHHQGAVLAAKNHFTGNGDVMEAGVNAPGDLAVADAGPIQCDTCHQTHRTDLLRVDTAWLPSTTVGAYAAGNDQYRLCTQCHGFIDSNAYGNKLMGSGTVASGTNLVGHHETSWYRIIATTHNDDPATAAIEGYSMRFTKSDGSVNANPCFDCHGHEALTNTNSDPTASTYEANATIYTDWAKSGHARGLFAAKFAASKTVTIPAGSRTDPARLAAQKTQVDTVMAASVEGGAFAGHNTGSCARCHSTEGFSYYFENLANNPNASQKGVLRCYGCHSNPGGGVLRTLKGAKAATNYTTDLGWNPPGYTLNYGKKAYPDVAASNICIACHDSREKDPGAITDASTNYNRTHYLQAATTMYVKMGFIAFTAESTIIPGPAGTTTTYWKSLKSDQDGGTVTSTHRKLGTPGMHGDSHNPTFFVTGNLDSNGPCVTCHFTGGHSQAIDQRAIDAVCSKCHDEEGGKSIATKAAFDQYFLEPQSEAYQAALKLAIQVWNDKNTGVELKEEDAGSEFVRPFVTGTDTEAGAADFATAMTVLGGSYNRTKVLGAVSNIVYLKREPAAYAHARTYSRRLIYDTIDYLDDGVINNSVSATAIAKSAVAGTPVSGLFGKNATKAFADSTLTTLATGTTEGMVYLIAWSRSTGAWTNAPQVIGKTDVISERP